MVATDVDEESLVAIGIHEEAEDQDTQKTDIVPEVDHKREMFVILVEVEVTCGMKEVVEMKEDQKSLER